jgi:tetratricopeptide (TPR) repeat protein
MRHVERAAALAVGLSALAAAPADAQWREITGAHITVVSDAGDSAAKNVCWQFEQIRSAIATLWPWAKVDLDKPLTVLAVKDENSMKALAPEYWERRGGVRPASVWVEGRDQYFIAIRSDVRTRDTDNLNPYTTAYFAYASLILQQDRGHLLPMWLRRGLAGVMSNTIVRDAYLLLGAPIPWELEEVRDRTRMSLASLVAVKRGAPELERGEQLGRFDAQSWAFVHFLMFAENGARRPALETFLEQVIDGIDPAVALRETIGPVEPLERPFHTYINRSIFSFQKINVDVSMTREGFAARAMTVSESSSLRALLHIAMDRPAEARAAMAEARKAEPSSPGGALADAMLLDAEEKDDEARAAFARAVQSGSQSAYAHYRLAMLLWRANPDRDTLARIEKLLAASVAFNNQHAFAYAALGEVRAALGAGEPLGLIGRAIALDPANPYHRLTAARVYWRLRDLDAALKAAELAVTMARTDEEKQAATALVAEIRKARSAG